MRIYETKNSNLNEDYTEELSPAWKLIIDEFTDIKKYRVASRGGGRKVEGA